MTENWVFGYGSLMWKPGFEHIEARPALLRGAHRQLCVYSYVHRGTPERPGLVLGLDRGGACRGLAFKVADECWSDVLDYLRAREQVTSPGPTNAKYQPSFSWLTVPMNNMPARSALQSR